MFDNKFITTLFGLIIAMIAINRFNSKSTNTIEGWEGMGQGNYQVKIDRMVAPSTSAAEKGDFFSVPGTYQALLNPRFSNVDYGANIRYNMPSIENQASPCNPLTFSNMAKENYVENYGCSKSGCGGGPVSCGAGGTTTSFHGGAPITDVNYADGNFNELLNQVYSDSQYPQSTSSLPVGNMMTINADGDVEQPIVYDRYIVANRNSRLRSQGDMIRGDLPIVPCSTGWFNVSVQPNIDLQQGAMQVMSGVNNDTSNALAELIYAASGNSQTSFGGIDMSNKLNSMSSTASGSVQISSFP